MKVRDSLYSVSAGGTSYGPTQLNDAAARDSPGARRRLRRRLGQLRLRCGRKRGLELHRLAGAEWTILQSAGDPHPSGGPEVSERSFVHLVAGALFALIVAGCSAKDAPAAPTTFGLTFPSTAAAVASDQVEIQVFEADALANSDLCEDLLSDVRSGQSLPTTVADSGSVSTCALLAGTSGPRDGQRGGAGVSCDDDARWIAAPRRLRCRRRRGRSAPGSDRSGADLGHRAGAGDDLHRSEHALREQMLKG